MPHVRPIAVCVVRRRSDILVARGVDSATGEVFYRPLGGAIEFGERSDAAVRRELAEEIGVSVGAPRLLAVLENLFQHEGRRGHEIVFVYEADLADPALYARDTFAWVGSQREGWEWIGWRALDDFASREIPLYPAGLFEVLSEPGSR